jgi:hypothetical protein
MAMHNYESKHGRLPPAVVYGEDGKPLHSWRVLILPFIEEDALYKQFNLKEPWDSPANLRLLEKMPVLYAAPPRKAKRMPRYHTVCHVFVGKGTPFEGRQGVRTGDDFPDGISSTLLIVEAGKPVPWTKPEDLCYDPDGPLPELQCLFKDGFRAVMADSSRHWVSIQTSESTLRAAITRNDGTPLGPDW